DEQGSARFTLPFMESYLLAKKLYEDKEVALSYFSPGAGGFNDTAFALYAELGPPPEFVAKLNKAIDDITERLTPNQGGHILLSGTLNPRVLEKAERLEAFKKRLNAVTSDVHGEKEGATEKQALLDTIDRIRGSATRKTAEADESNARLLGDDAMEIWYAAI